MLSLHIGLNISKSELLNSEYILNFLLELVICPSFLRYLKVNIFIIYFSVEYGSQYFVIVVD